MTQQEKEQINTLKVKKWNHAKYEKEACRIADFLNVIDWRYIY